MGNNGTVRDPQVQKDTVWTQLYLPSTGRQTSKIHVRDQSRRCIEPRPLCTPISRPTSRQIIGAVTNLGKAP